MRCSVLTRRTPIRSSTPLRQKSPMQRTCGLQPGTSQLARTPLKRRSPKRRPMSQRRYALACRGERCYLQIPGAPTHDRRTVSPCHSNQLAHGKGMAIKADDEKTVPGCAWCHHAIDQGNWLTKDERRAYWDDAYARWLPVRALKLAGQSERGEGV